MLKAVQKRQLGAGRKLRACSLPHLCICGAWQGFMPPAFPPLPPAPGSQLNTGDTGSEMWKEVGVGREPWVWVSNHGLLFNPCLPTTLAIPSEVQLSL